MNVHRTVIYTTTDGIAVDNIDEASILEAYHVLSLSEEKKKNHSAFCRLSEDERDMLLELTVYPDTVHNITAVLLKDSELLDGLIVSCKYTFAQLAAQS